MGVWIETYDAVMYDESPDGHTLRGCVDWNIRVMIAVDCVKVTPYVGVWIETYGLRNAIDYGTVTPYVGVWIETFMSLSSSGVGMSHPTWVCGLKLSGTIRT